MREVNPDPYLEPPEEYPEWLERCDHTFPCQDEREHLALMEEDADIERGEMERDGYFDS